MTGNNVATVKEKITPVVFLFALLDRWLMDYPDDTIEVDRFYYAVSKLARFNVPDIFKGWDFYASGSTIFSGRLEDLFNTMVVWSQLHIITSPGLPTTFTPAGDGKSASSFPDQVMLEQALEKFCEYLHEPISIKHLIV